MITSEETTKRRRRIVKDTSLQHVHRRFQSPVASLDASTRDHFGSVQCPKLSIRFGESLGTNDFSPDSA